MKRKPKYLGIKQSIIKWPPQQAENPSISLEAGEGYIMDLRRWPNDKSLGAHWWNRCCECGFRHVFIFNVFRSLDGNWCLQVKPYADEMTRLPKEIYNKLHPKPKKVRKKNGKRKGK